MSLDERLRSILAPFKQGAPLTGADLTPAESALLAAWPSIPPRLTTPLFLGSIPQHGANRWRYAWRFRAIDWKEIESRLPGSLQPDARTAFDRLVEKRLIFPDGTVHPALESGPPT